jgi:dipeptidyl-peptidase-4
MMLRFRATCAALLLALLFVTPPDARAQQVTAEDYAWAEGFLSSFTRPLVFRDAVNPVWISDTRFWYSVNVPDGQEFVMVDAQRGRKQPAFDHVALARAVNEASGGTFTAHTLPINGLEWTNDREIRFAGEGHAYVCDIRRYRCTAEEAPEARRGGGFGGRFGANTTSPDGRWDAFIRDYNLWVKNLETGEEKALTSDGVEFFGYATNNAGWTKSNSPVLEWSDDSRKIATFQHDGRGVGYMHLVSTDVGHPRLESWQYPLPGDSVIFRIERVILDVESGELVRLDMPADQHRSTITDHVAYRGGWADIDWAADGSEVAFVSSSRDHKDAWLRIADAETGKVTEVLHEHEPTFFESGVGDINWRYLDASDEFLWWSERTDWGHLYLYDKQGNLKNAVTSGNWLFERIVRLDEEARRIWFYGSNREPGDPYYDYLYAVNFDGSDLKLLTPEPATHSVSFSPDGRYFVDTFSEPHVPPKSVLRTAEGKLVVELEEADISALVASGWQPPTPVQVKARDGETDIWGLMYTPTRLDETRSYPVVNYVYPGPQSGSVGSRSFNPSRRDNQALAELGFVVVEVDGMGTPGRSKSFHEYYYGNMGDNTLPDQIAAIQQLAAHNPYMDLDRVGIWGHSGGGFATVAALLRHPDFYKVGVSGAGNHDNRTYEDDWGEKWQGLLVENEDGTTNYDNQANQLLVENLKGKLLIAHGTMDANVPPNNTLKVVEELMNANKDFDMYIFPNSGHGFRQGNFWVRKRWDYFVQHLIGATPPKEYTFGERGPREAM